MVVEVVQSSSKADTKRADGQRHDTNTEHKLVAHVVESRRLGKGDQLWKVYHSLYSLPGQIIRMTLAYQPSDTNKSTIQHKNTPLNQLSLLGFKTTFMQIFKSFVVLTMSHVRVARY